MEAVLHPLGGLVAFRSHKQSARKLPASHKSIFEMCPPAILQHPAVQELIVDSFGVFGRMHENSATLDSQKDGALSLGVDDLVATSQFYRDLLKRCKKHLEQSTLSPCDLPPGLTAESVAAHSEQLRSIHIVWSLCEFLYFSSADCTAAQEMIRWAEDNFCIHDDWLIEMTSLFDVDSAISAGPLEGRRSVRKKGRPCLNYQPRYWDAVFSFLFYGQIEKARNLLASHAQAGESAFRVMDQLLDSIPLTNADAAGQQQTWDRWRALVQQRLVSGVFVAQPELDQICKLITGDTQTFLLFQNRVWSCWYQFFIPYLLYVRPVAMPYELESVLTDCLALLRTNPCMNDSPFDDILMAAFSFDSWRVVQLASEAYTDWWFPVHFHDLLKACGSATQADTSGLFPEGGESSLGEHLMLEYASSLMRDSKLWEVGLAYLDHCPVLGACYAEAFIERVPLNSDEKARRVLQICDLKGMQSVGKSICRQRGMAELRKPEANVTKALQWCLQGQEPWFANFLATVCLQRHAETGLVKSMQFLDHVGDSVLMAPGLGFLVKYRQFYTAREQGKMAIAAQLLADLILSRVVPKEFWHTLFRDLVPFLTDYPQGDADALRVPQSYFDSATIYGIMAIMNDYSNATELLEIPCLLEQRSGKLGTDVMQILADIRRGLTLTLSAAIMQEADGAGRMEQ